MSRTTHRIPTAASLAVIRYTDGSEIDLPIQDHDEFVELAAAIKHNHHWMGVYAAFPKPDPDGPRPLGVRYKQAFTE